MLYFDIVMLLAWCFNFVLHLCSYINTDETSIAGVSIGLMVLSGCFVAINVHRIASRRRS